MKSWAQNKKQGFTIVELLVVVVVIGILAAITIVAYNGIQQRARDSARKSDIGVIQKALELYHIDNGGYPNCSGGTYLAGQGRGACDTSTSGFVNALTPKYIDKTPKDPIHPVASSYRYVFGSKKVDDITYAATSDDNYIIGVSYESQGGPYSTQMGTSTYNYVFGSNN